MLEQRVPGSAAQIGGPELPDLTGVDLRTLRRLDDDALTAAVEDVLRCPGSFTDAWNDGP
ncbi:hypothetical protein OG875_08735 [Streptomyces sp. NBC_01498]|uniref:hypothetical protein n=1 Tax=Streptomyces sp. NBC_01498 TaxID=2975870 RepID=UPI002E7B5067|nr:hypothetical protein [Streptomyces sp. NBC_01498]WTL24677.1 hypothetical protein OG875_08735 [Streptomyces sp. NBC_01498]